MQRFYWFLFAVILVVARFALLGALYFFDSPTGGALVADWNRFLWHTWFADIGFIMAFTLVFALVSLLLQRCADSVRNRGLKILKIVSVVVAGLYLLACGTDDEVMRWMNQRLTFSFIGTYMNATSDMGLVMSVFKGGAFHFLFTFFLVMGFTVAVAVYSCKMDLRRVFEKPLGKKPLVALGLVILLAVLGCTSHMWFNPSHRRWPRIKPVAYVLTEEVLQSFESVNPPEDYREGILALGGNPDAEYPFWHWAGGDSATAAAVESQSLESFKNRDFENRPDIVLFNIESLRAWTSDMRIDANCERFPNLCALAKSGAYFPNAHSVGYPSIEGFLGIMTGVVSHPRRALLYSYPNTRLRSIADVLKDAGYYRVVLCGGDPKFDNELVWQQKWFDYNEFKPENDNDVAMARRFAELYKERPANTPLFFHWMSRSMHIPFTLPEDMGETPKTSEDAYLRAEAYMDSAIGIVMDAVKNGPRAQSTLFVLTGDHAYPNNAQTMESDRLGKINEGETWVSLMFAGPGIEPRVDSRPVSQGDISKSILNYLDLDVSNHFMGRALLPSLLPTLLPSISTSPSTADVLADSLDFSPVYSFRQNDIAMREDSLAFFATMDNAELASVRAIAYDAAQTLEHPVEGYTAGATVQVDSARLARATNAMRAAARAWEYTVNKNRVMP